MRRTISLREANQTFARCIREVEGGAEYVITRNGEPVARLLPIGDRRVLPPRQQAALARAHAARIPTVIPFLDWCILRSVSPSTGERLVKAGKVKLTRLSARRRGVRSDHDAEYLASCAAK